MQEMKYVEGLSKEMFEEKTETKYKYIAEPGLAEETVRKISKEKNEPEWMLQKRLKAFEIFKQLQMPEWGPSLKELDLNKIVYYTLPDAKKNAKNWDEVPAEIKKTFEKLGIPEAEQKYLAGAGAQFECLSEDSLVYINPRGPVEIKNIKDGDYVFAFDEKSNEIKRARVIEIKEKGLNEVYEVVVDNKKIKTTLNHPFLTLSYYKKEGKIRGRYKREWKCLKDLKEGDLVAVAKKLPYEGKSYKLNQPVIKDKILSRNQFDIYYEIDITNSYNKVELPWETNNDLMWFFGAYVGDGYIKREKGKDKKRVYFAIPDSQPQFRRELKKVVKKLFDYKIKSNDKYWVSINSTIIADFIEANGFKGNALQKRVPSWIFGLPIEQRLAFLGGYVDSDGYPTDERKSNELIFKTPNRELINDLRNLLIYCEFHPSNIHLIKDKNPLNKEEIIFSNQITITGDLKTIDSRYPPKTKRLRAKKIWRSFSTAHGTDFRKHTNKYLGFAKVDSIKSIGIEKVYDIEVEGYHNFISEGLIVHNSNVIYHKLREDLEKQGVIFLDFDEAVKKHPEMVKEYFMTKCVPATLHKFAALHGAVFSGGTFIYVPENVKVDLPLQAYFRMNAEKGGQFEHTLIIVDKNAEVSYIEGCSSPRYTTEALHAGCVEIFVKENAVAKYHSVENWSKNTYNLNTKRAIVEKNGTIEWINGNMGCLIGESKVFTNPKGHISIKDIEQGDKVYVWDENINSIKKSLVKSKIFSGVKKVYKLEAGGREIEASANHPFLTLARKKNKPYHKKSFFNFEWKPLEQLKKGDVVGIIKKLPIEGKPYSLPKFSYPTVKSNNQYSSFKMNAKHLYNQNIIIPNETNEDFMWLMGILLGDGHIDSESNKINIATHIREDIRPVLIDIVKKLFNFEIKDKQERYVEIYSNILCKLFIDIGFGGNADTKNVPDWVFTLPKNQIMAFLAGYFDSDGHPDDHAIAFTSINKEILKKIQLLGIVCGFGVSRIFKHGDKGQYIILGNMCNCQDSWRILFNGKEIYEMPTKSKKDKELIDKIKTRRNFSTSKGLNFKSKTNEEIGFARIDKIEFSGEKPTYDIEVEGYHNFISNGLIVHNSKVTMLYPTSVLIGENAKSDFLGIAFAGEKQNQDTGSKVYHLAPNTSSTIKSKSISKDGGITTYRGLVNVKKGAVNSKSFVQCDALILDERSVSNTVPYMEIKESKVDVGHEATVGKISKEKLFYLMSRGLSEEQVMKMIVAGFIEPIVKALPMEYAVELNRLIEMEMENAIG